MYSDIKSSKNDRGINPIIIKSQKKWLRRVSSNTKDLKIYSHLNLYDETKNIDS